MKRIIIKLGLILLGSVSSVTALFFLTDYTVHKHNVFVRQFPPHLLAESDTFDVGYNSYYIAGTTVTNIYLGNTTSPLRLLVVKNNMLDSQHVTLNSDELRITKFWSLRTKIDSPYFYLTDGAVPRIFTGKLGEWIPKRYPFDSAFFADYEPIDAGTMAVRSISSKTHEFVLGKQSVASPHITFAYDLLERQIDGKFCVDGMLHYNRTLGKLVYLYYYRNQFIVYDTSLRLDYRGNTIDTVSHAQIKVASVSSMNSFTHVVPPLLVNKQSSSSGRFLYVNSALMAKNEEEDFFDKSSVVDVYDLLDRTYKFSFYIPSYNGKKMHDFKVDGNRLIVLIDRMIIVYQLPQLFFAT